MFFCPSIPRHGMDTRSSTQGNARMYCHTWWVLGSQFRETIYISEVNGARKVKSNAQVAGSYEQELRPRADMFFLGVAGEDSAPNSNFFKLLE